MDEPFTSSMAVFAGAVAVVLLALVVVLIVVVMVMRRKEIRYSIGLLSGVHKAWDEEMELEETQSFSPPQSFPFLSQDI
jgi:hypothetical protein